MNGILMLINTHTHTATYLTPLDKNVLPCTNEISSIEAGLVLRGHKLPLGSQLMSVLHCADGVVLNRVTQYWFTLQQLSSNVQSICTHSTTNSTVQRSQL